MATKQGPFKVDFARGQTVTATNSWKSGKGYETTKAVDGNPHTYWEADAGDTAGKPEGDFKKTVAFNPISLGEPVFMGQRVKQYRVEYWDGTTWQLFSEGTTIGYQKLDRRDAISAQKVRLVIENARAYPLISHFGVYMTPFTAQEINEKKP